MIIHNRTLYSKNLKFFLLSFEIVIIVGSLALLLITAIGQTLNNELAFYSASSVIWTLGVVSVTDLISFISSRRFITLSLFISIKNKITTKVIKPTTEQQKVLNNFFANTDNSINCVTVLINGLKGSGKSECTDYILERALSKIINDNRKINSEFYFIDCYNDSENASSFINDKLTSEHLNNDIIVVDNCNEADGSIVLKLKEVIENKNCSVLIIEENSEFFKNKLTNLSGNQILEVSFNDIIFLKNNSIFRNLINKEITELQAKILFTCALYCRYFNIFNWNQIRKSLNLGFYKSIIGYKFIKYLIKQEILKYFPLNTTYLKFKNVDDLDYILKSKSLNENLFEAVLEKLCSTDEFKNPEVQWQCLFELSLKSILKIDPRIRLNLFKKATKNGNFKKLFNILINYTQINKCADEFRYELGYLHYNLGEFNEAFNQYNLIKNFDKIEINIRLIESMHGSKDTKTKNQVLTYINELKSFEEPAKNYGSYWEYHIKSEQGDFRLEDFDNIRLKLILQYNDKPDFLIETILERCFTDEIRVYWLKGELTENINNELKKEYINIFKNKPNCKYYQKLYFTAGFYHYFIIPNKIWLEDNFTLLAETINLTLDSYHDAIFCSYNKIKSKMAAEVKLADATTLTMNCDYDRQVKIVENFKNSSEKQAIDVFVAYSDCLLAKIKILKYMLNENLLISNEEKEQIISHIENSRKIYKEYNNKYGVLRCDYISILFEMLSNFSIEKDSYFNNAKNKIISYSKYCYPLEKRFIDKLLRYKKDSYLTMYNSLKYYPIILQ